MTSTAPVGYIYIFRTDEHEYKEIRATNQRQAIRLATETGQSGELWRAGSLHRIGTTNSSYDLKDQLTVEQKKELVSWVTLLKPRTEPSKEHLALFVRAYRESHDGLKRLIDETLADSRIFNPYGRVLKGIQNSEHFHWTGDLSDLL